MDTSGSHKQDLLKTACSRWRNQKGPAPACRLLRWLPGRLNKFQGPRSAACSPETPGCGSGAPRAGGCQRLLPAPPPSPPPARDLAPAGGAPPRAGPPPHARGPARPRPTPAPRAPGLRPPRWQASAQAAGAQLRAPSLQSSAARLHRVARTWSSGQDSLPAPSTSPPPPPGPTPGSRRRQLQ